MTQCAGKVQARSAIDSLITAGSTDLIAANHLALSLALNDTSSSNIHIVILTDGEPDKQGLVLPEFFKAIAPLEQARAAGRHHGVSLSTFGFGYDMNSVRPLITLPSVSHSRVFSGASAADEHRRPRHVLLHPRLIHDRHRLLSLYCQCNVPTRLLYFNATSLINFVTLCSCASPILLSTFKSN